MALILYAGAQQQAQVQVVVLGEVRKIDVKNGVIVVRERLLSDRRRRSPAPPMLGEGFPPPAIRGRRSSRQIDTKVMYSETTLMKSADKQIGVGELNIGDAVRVAASPTNKGFVATQIEKLRAAR